MRSAWLAALLLLGTIPAAEGQPKGSQACKYECQNFTGKIPFQMLKNYEMIECRKVTSVLLTTKKNRTFCAKPTEQWVKDAMHKLDATSAPPTVGILTASQSSRFDKRLGNAAPVPTQAGHPAHATETSSTAAYETSVTKAEELKSSAVSSTLTGPLASKPSPSATSKPEVLVSRTTTRPGLLANRNTPSSFPDGPKSFGERLAPGGKGLEDISGSLSDLVAPPTSPGTKATEDHKVPPTQSTLPSSSTIINLLKKHSTSTNRLLPSSDQQSSTRKQVMENSTVGFSTVAQRVGFVSPPGTATSANGSRTNSVKHKTDVVSVPGWAPGAPVSTQANRGAFSKPSGTLSPSKLPEEHFTEKSRGEAMTPPPETPLSRHRSHIITGVFLAFVFCVWLTITAVCAKASIHARASPVEMAQGLTYSKTDPLCSAHTMQLL
ncbi:fractalkine [Paroedura picta]|uniref:fractalkine n=1 Tax=Paroedura picta TaxID=143630 RepID=UPI00405629E1